MKRTRFYLEYASPADKRKGKHSGNVFARFLDVPVSTRRGKQFVEGVGAAYDRANSPVNTTSADTEWLLTQCKRIGEAQARQIHPNLFVFLDA